MRFGEKIRRMRVQRDWNQETLAVKAGLSRATIYNAEAAKWHIEINNKTLSRIAYAFNVGITELITNKDGNVVSVPDPFEDNDTREPLYDDPPPYEPHETESVIKNTKGLESLPSVIEWFKLLNAADQSAVVSMLLRYVTQINRIDLTTGLLLKLDEIVAEALNDQGHKKVNVQPKHGRKEAS